MQVAAAAVVVEALLSLRAVLAVAVLVGRLRHQEPEPVGRLTLVAVAVVLDMAAVER